MRPLGRRAYRALLRLLPRPFRDAHGREMEALFAESMDARDRGRPLARARGWVAGTVDVVALAARLRLGALAATLLPGTSTVDTLAQDLRYGLRSLLRAPGFTVIAVVTLAVGIGATTAIASLVDAVLLRPPAHVEAPDELVALYTSDYSGPRYGGSSYLDFLDFRTGAPALVDAAMVAPAVVNLAGDDGMARSLVGEYVSANYFAFLGVPLRLGRGFTPDEDDPASGAAVAVLGHGLWERRFGADPGVVGRTVRVSGHTVTVVGVAPEGFRGSLPVVTSEMWLPVATEALIESPETFSRRGFRGVLVQGRLAKGATLATLQAQLTALASRLQEIDPGAWTDVRDEVRRITAVADTRLPPQFRGAATGFAGLLLAVVAVVLLIACANVANLTLARASGRHRELAVRLSVGAGRGRVVRQLLTESAVVGLLGGLGGVAMAYGALGLADALPPVSGIAVSLDVGMDVRILLFSLALTLATVLAVGLVPAVRASGPDLASALKAGAEGGAAGQGVRLRSVLVVGQVAASLVLLVGAGLFLKSVRAALALDPGFQVEDVATLSLHLEPEGYTPEEALALFDGLRGRVEALPIVRGATVADALPLTLNASRRRNLVIEGYEPAQGEDMEFPFLSVDDAFVSTLGMRVVAGRDFSEADGPQAPRAVLVNRSMAERFWPDGRALGSTVSWDGGATPATVVGILENARLRSLRDEGGPAFLIPLAQSPSSFLSLAARTAPGRVPEVLEALRREVRAADPSLTGITALESYGKAMAFTLLPQRAALWLLSLAGGLGLLLAAVGLYGVMSFLVALRTREIGVRLALGASRARVVRMVVARGLRLAVAGALVGLVAAGLATRFLSSLLFGVSPLDAPVFAAMTASALLVAVLASWVPARRASRVEPARTLRVD